MTGVQTCALPIFSRLLGRPFGGRQRQGLLQLHRHGGERVGGGRGAEARGPRREEEGEGPRGRRGAGGARRLQAGAAAAVPGAGRQGWGGGRAGRSGGPEPGPARGRPERRSPARGSQSGDRLEAGLAGLASVAAASARACWACALSFGEEGAPLHFYGSTADHVENNNSLVRGQRQLVLLGAPSPAAGFPDRASPAPPRSPPCAPDRARACGTAERRPAPREGSAEGNGGTHPRLR